MALASSLFESFHGGDKLSEIISCVWCKSQKLTQLVQFDCFHLSCQDCIQINIENQRSNAPFKCPTCHMICIVPKDGQFPDEPLQHKMHQITKLLSNDKPNCTYCQQIDTVSSASRVCITCKLGFCEQDAKRHKVVPGHKLVLHEELAIEPNLSLMLKSKTGICQMHSLEQNHFCKSCQCQICPECALSSHTKHKKDSVANIAREYRKILEEKLSAIEKSEKSTDDNVKELDKKFGGIEESYRKEEETLQKGGTFERNAKGTLRRKEQEAKVHSFKNKLQIEEEKNKIKQCQIAGLYVKVFLEYSSDSDVIHDFQKLLTNLQNCSGEDKAAFSLSETIQGLTNVKKDVVAKLKGQSSENMNETIKRKRQSVWKMKANWEAGSWSGVSACEDVFLVVWGQTMKWFGMDGKERREMKCKDLKWGWDVEVCGNEVYVSDWDLREVLVMDLDGKMKRKLSLPEEERGIVGALGLAIDRKSKDVYVSSAKTETVYKIEHGSQLASPLITDGLDGPCYLCVVPGCHLVVSNHISNTVIKYDLEGNVMWRYGLKESGEAELLSPQGVCTDNLGDIYIADSNHNRIVRVSADGMVVSTINIGEKMIGPKAISFGKDRLVITTITSRQMYVVKQKKATKSLFS